MELAGRNDRQVELCGCRVELDEIEAALADHPAVRRAAVVRADTGAAGPRLVAYVVAEPGHALVRDAARRAEAGAVERWRALYDDLYGASTAPADDPADDWVGWNSSYTGAPIPTAEMTEWVEATVASIRALSPRRILEIGCGTGLLLRRLAADAELYAGTDFSGRVLARLGEEVRRRGLAHVHLLERAADRLGDLSGLGLASFDTVVLNSIVQYFPSADYLERVLGALVAGLPDGATIFLGDLRSLPRLPAFHASVELYRADDDTPADEVARRVVEQLAMEEELALDPAFFTALAGRLPRLGGAQVRVKRGASRNELTAFRYDAVLQVGAPAVPPVAPRWLDWRGEGLDLERLRRRLESAPGTALGLAGVPDDRAAAAVAAAAWLGGRRGDGTGSTTAAWVRHRTTARGVDPEALWRLGAALGRPVTVSPSTAGDPALVDAAFLAAGAAPGPVLRPPAAGRDAAPLASYASAPQQGKLASWLARRLRAHLAERLPGSRIPAVFIVLPALPLHADGKAGRDRLAAPA